MIHLIWNVDPLIKDNVECIDIIREYVVVKVKLVVLLDVLLVELVRLVNDELLFTVLVVVLNFHVDVEYAVVTVHHLKLEPLRTLILGVLWSYSPVAWRPGDSVAARYSWRGKIKSLVQLYVRRIFARVEFYLVDLVLLQFLGLFDHDAHVSVELVEVTVIEVYLPQQVVLYDVLLHILQNELKLVGENQLAELSQHPWFESLLLSFAQSQ